MDFWTTSHQLTFCDEESDSGGTRSWQKKSKQEKLERSTTCSIPDTSSPISLEEAPEKMRSITVWILALAWMTEQTVAYKSHAPFDPVATRLPRPPSAHQSRRHHDRNTDKEGFEFHLNLLMSIRGGSLDIGKSESGFVLTKVRNIVRSLLSTVEASAPPVAALFRGFLGTVEILTGVSLLPLKEEPEEKGKKKKKSGSAKKKKASSGEEEESAKKPPSKQSTTKKAPPTKPTKKSAKNASSMASEWQKKQIKTTSPNYRIQRELKAFLSEPPPNLSVKVGKNLRVWIVTMKGAKNTIYEGETFKLRVSFPAKYPDIPPSVYFLPPNIPLHEHVYTNGDICLSLLGKDWRPSMTAQSIAVSILSILSSAQSKSLPMDNARHAQNRPGVYQEGWVYHDDKLSSRRPVCCIKMHNLTRCASAFALPVANRPEKVGQPASHSSLLHWHTVPYEGPPKSKHIRFDLEQSAFFKIPTVDCISSQRLYCFS